MLPKLLTLLILMSGVLGQTAAPIALQARAATVQKGPNEVVAFVRRHFRDELVLKSVWPDGTHAQRIRKRGVCGTWSPDGRRIAYATNRGVIAISSPNGVHQRRIDTERRVYAVTDWSPNGRRLLFEAKRKGKFEIYSIRKDGRNVKRVTQDDFEDHDAAWSPDGKHIAFVFTNRDGGGASHLGVVRVDGTGFRRLTKGSSDWTESPTWVGRRIAYVASERDYRKGEAIFSIRMDGTNRKRLNGINEPRELDSSVLSGEIAFATYYGSGGVFVMDSDGTHMHSVASGGRNSCPNWRTLPN